MSTPPVCKKCSKPPNLTTNSVSSTLWYGDFDAVNRRDDAGSSRQELKERALKDKEQSRNEA